MSPLGFYDDALAKILVETTSSYERTRKSHIAFLCMAVELGPDKLLELALEKDSDADVSRFFQEIMSGGELPTEELLAEREFALSIKITFGLFWQNNLDKPADGKPRADAIDVLNMMKSRLQMIFGHDRAEKMIDWLGDQIMNGDPDKLLVSEGEYESHHANLEKMYLGTPPKMPDIDSERHNHESGMIPCPKCGKEKRLFPDQTKRFKCPCGFNEPWPFK